MKRMLAIFILLPYMCFAGQKKIENPLVGEIGFKVINDGLGFTPEGPKYVHAIESTYRCSRYIINVLGNIHNSKDVKDLDKIMLDLKADGVFDVLETSSTMVFDINRQKDFNYNKKYLVNILTKYLFEPRIIFMKMLHDFDLVLDPLLIKCLDCYDQTDSNNSIFLTFMRSKSPGEDYFYNAIDGDDTKLKQASVEIFIFCHYLFGALSNKTKQLGRRYAKELKSAKT